MENLVQKLVSAGKAIMLEPQKVINIHFNKNFIGEFDFEVPHLAMYMAMQDLLGKGPSAEVTTSTFYYRRSRFLTEGTWGVYSESDPHMMVVFAWLPIEKDVISVFHKNNVYGDQLLRHTRYTDVNDKETDLFGEYWEDNVCSISSSVDFHANIMLEYCDRRMDDMSNKDVLNVINRRLAIAQIIDLPIDVRRIVADSEDPWDTFYRSLCIRGYSGYSGRLPTLVS